MLYDHELSRCILTFYCFLPPCETVNAQKDARAVCC